MTAFSPFQSAENALENLSAITEHELTNDLRVSNQLLSDFFSNTFQCYQNFLESNLSKSKKARQFPLGVVSQ
jgi:hypothetical protein